MAKPRLNDAYKQFSQPPPIKPKKVEIPKEINTDILKIKPYTPSKLDNATEFFELKNFKIAPKGEVGFDNARENIDPNIRTQNITTKQISASSFIGCKDLVAQNTLFVSGNTLVVRNGQVGIGTASPEVALHIKSPYDGYTEMKMDGSAVGGTKWTIGTGYSGEGLPVNNFYWYLDGTPAGVKMTLSPTGVISGANLTLTDSLTVSGTTLVVKNGMVGIGTASPTALFHTGSATGLRVDSSGNIVTGGYANINGAIKGSLFQPTVVAANWVAKLRNNDYAFTFLDKDAGNLMEIEGTGNVGIKTTKPDTLLSLSGGALSINDYGTALTANNHAGQIIVSGGALIYVGTSNHLTTIAVA